MAKRKLEYWYIGGKMTGEPEHGYPKFFAAEKRLHAKGYKTINPARLNRQGDDWFVCLRNDIKFIVTKCKGIALLDNWHKSPGAKLELAIAIRLGMDIIDAQTLKPMKIELKKRFSHRRKKWTG